MLPRAGSRAGGRRPGEEGSGLLTSPSGPREPSGGACCPEYTALGERALPGSQDHGTPVPPLRTGRCGRATAGLANRRGPARCGAHPHSVHGAGGSARRRWRSPGDGCSRAGSDGRLNTTSPGEAVARSHRWEPGQGRGSSESAPSRRVPVPTSPSPARPGGAPGPRGPAPVGPTKTPESPPPTAFGVSPVPHPSFPEFSPGRREWRSDRP